MSVRQARRLGNVTHGLRLLGTHRSFSFRNRRQVGNKGQATVLYRCLLSATPTHRKLAILLASFVPFRVVVINDKETVDYNANVLTRRSNAHATFVNEGRRGKVVYFSNVCVNAG